MTLFAIRSSLFAEPANSEERRASIQYSLYSIRYTITPVTET
jgi:hypothetical protein